MKKKCSHLPLSDQEINQLLEMANLKKTPLKKEILKILSESKNPMAVSDIRKKLKLPCNPSTIFRSITQFKEKLLLKECHLGEEFFRYELIDSKDHSHHHHHVRCRDCGIISRLDLCGLEKFEKSIRKMGFKGITHSLEFSGICAKCV